MEAVTGGATLAQMAILGVAFLKRIPQIQSDYLELCKEIDFIRAICDRANEASLRKPKPTPPLAKDSPILHAKAALEEITTELEQIKQSCEGLNDKGVTAAKKRKWLIKEGKIAKMVSKAQKARMDLALAMSTEAVVIGNEAIELQAQRSTQLGGMDPSAFLNMMNEILRKESEKGKQQEDLAVQLGQLFQNMNQGFTEIRELVRVGREETTVSPMGGSRGRVQELDDDGNVMDRDDESTAELSGLQSMEVPIQVVQQSISMSWKRKRCSYYCRCRCHVKPWRFSTPRWTEQWIGSWQLEIRLPKGGREWALDCCCTRAESIVLRTLRPHRVIPSRNPEWMFVQSPIDHLRLNWQGGLMLYPDDEDEYGTLVSQIWIKGGTADLLEFLMAQWAAILPKQGLPRVVGYAVARRLNNIYDDDDKEKRLLEQVASFVEDDEVELEPEQTALHEAAIRGSGVQEALGALKTPAIEALETWGAEGKMPLHYAAMYGHCDAARELLEAGADVNCLDSDKWTPLMLTAVNNHIELMQLLLSTGRTCKTKCRIDKQSQAGITVLHLAAAYRHPNAVRLLLNHGASASVRDYRGWTPLHYAAYSDEQRAPPEDTEATLRLLRDLANADINSQTTAGDTPLALAIIHNQPAAARFLSEAGADYTIIDSDTQNLLHNAALKSKTSILHYLHELNLEGVSVHLRDKDGHTPWDLFIYSLRAPFWQLIHIPRSTKEESQAFVQLFAGIRDRSIRDDLVHLGHALNALSKNDPAAACSSLSNLVTAKQKCGELDVAKFYRGLEKDIYACGITAQQTKAIQEVIQELESELATNPWDLPTRFDSLGPITFKEQEFYDFESDSIASEDTSQSSEASQELENDCANPASDSTTGVDAIEL